MSFKERCEKLLEMSKIDELSTTIQSNVAKHKVNVPDGDYDAKRSGYVIEIAPDIRIDTKEGVRGRNIPTHVRIHDGMVDIVEPYDAGTFYRLKDRKSMNENLADRPKTDAERLRLAIVSELDAVNLYDQLAGETDNEDVRKVMLDISLEEKVHVDEFRKILEKIDPQTAEAETKATEEIAKLTGDTKDTKEG